MLIKETQNNYAFITGTVESEPTISHEIYEEKFYNFKVKSQRLSDSFDIVNVTVSERLLNDNLNLSYGAKLNISGQFRSYNNYSEVGNKLLLTLFAKDVKETSADTSDKNEIYLDGYICKAPIYRITPFGREITDILLAVNRIHNKSDYIPCIAWGRNAKFSENLSVGDRVRITGRIQSRDYQKKLDDETEITKTAFEVSIGKLELIKDEI